jgi:hypothetical protein
VICRRVDLSRLGIAIAIARKANQFAVRRVGKAQRAHPLSVELALNGGHASFCPPYETTPALCGVSSQTDEQNAQVTPLCNH